jgi:hypothetical protein
MIPVAHPSQADFAAALLDPELPCPRGLRAWNGSDPARRFAVHRNNVIASLVEALADTFPVVQALVGAEFFRAMAAVFARTHPPDSPLLHRYGGELPAFIEGFAPARGLPYLADVARLELARVEACHGADAAPLSRAAAALVLANGERVGQLRFVLHPALRWLVSPHPVVSLWAAHQGQGALEDIDLSQGESALVVRPALEVMVLRCDPASVAFVEALHAGAAFADAAAAASEVPGFDPGATLSLLMAHGALTAIALPEELDP